jgi:hypothetical protein
MTNPDQGPEGPSDRRRKPPTTLDLTAAEIGGAAAGQANASEAGATGDAEGAAAGDATGTTGEASAPPLVRWPSLLAAGLAGGIVVLLAGGLVWRAGWIGNDARVMELSARLAGLELQVRELSQRIPQVAANAAAGEDVAVRLAKLEAALAAPRASVSDPTLAARIPAAESAARAAVEAVADLTRRTETMAAGLSKLAERLDAATQGAAVASRQAAETVPDTKAERADLERLSARTAAIETTLNSVTEQMAKRASPADPAARRAVLAITLRDAVERGIPFAAGLTSLKPLVADQNALLPLEPFAASGVPTSAALAQEFSTFVPAMVAAIDRPPQDGFLSRLQSNAERLVRVRPVDGASGDEPSAVISRAEFKAGRGDLAGAAAELEKLPPPVRAPAESWTKKVQMRGAAVLAAQRLTAGALAAIATPQGTAER